MTETATIVQRLTANKVLVQITRGAACDTCHAKGACAPLSRGSIVTFEAEDPLNCEPGDLVEVAIAEGAVLKAVGWVYGLPIALALILSLAIWNWMPDPEGRDLMAAGGFIAGAGLGMLALRLVERAIKEKSTFSVKVVGRGQGQGQEQGQGRVGSFG